jgi:ParB family transcriptional regulator, chromosome partitioning protein
MTSPKDIRNALLGVGLARANSDIPPSPSIRPETPARVSSGAVGAVSRSLSRFEDQLREAQALASSGERIVELSVDDIDPSFVRDRLAVDAAQHEQLIQSIREHGQQVPILVRPNPSNPERFQIAYGHRRYQACFALGIAVRAVIRTLDDSALIIAQGQENSARQDLSFIERALFATILEEKGFSRDVAMAALSTDKTEISKLMSVVRSIPREILDSIGAAPKAGRTRWLGLAEKLKDKKALSQVQAALSEKDFNGLQTDERFARLFLAASARPKRNQSSRDWISPEGTRPVRLERRLDRVVLSVNESLAPQFGDFLFEQLPDLFEAYRARKTT